MPSNRHYSVLGNVTMHSGRRRIIFIRGKYVAVEVKSNFGLINILMFLKFCAYKKNTSKVSRGKLTDC